MYVYFGHHKCASTWTMEILNMVCSKIGLRLKKFIELEDQPPINVDFIADTGADKNHLELLKPLKFRGFHVIRDPRDIVVSAYYSHKYSHPMGSWLEEQRKVLNRVDFEEGMRLSIDFRSKQFREMANWDYKKPNIFETRFERITVTPFNEFSKIFQFLGIIPDELDPQILEEILNTRTFDLMADGREKGQEDIKHHYRKGIQGDWVKYFSRANKDYFKEQYGQLLIDLGYEENFSW